MIGRVVGIASISAALMCTVPNLVSGADASGSTKILVTSASDLVNGDIETVAGLRRHPGRDGISLREALEASNYDPGTYAIRFARSLAGTVIEASEQLPGLTGGRVDLDGDIDADGRPDVTIRAVADIEIGIHVASSSNRINGLQIEGFGRAVAIGPPSEVAVVGQSFVDIAISGLIIHHAESGITLDSGMSACEPPCSLDYHWSNITVSGNTIEAERAGIFFFVARSGDHVEGVAIVDNSVRITGPGLGPGINVETAGESTGAHISDVLIARNTIEGSPDGGIQVGAGGNRAQEGTLERVQIVDNRLDLESHDPLWSSGIIIEAGSDTADMAIGPPLRYMDDNLVSDVLIRGNTLKGDLVVGISAQVGQDGGRRNRVIGLVIEANVVLSTRAAFGSGASLFIAAGPSYHDRAGVDNEISDVIIRGNEFTIAGVAEGGDCGDTHASAIALVGGGESGRGNEIRDVVIEDNTIDTGHTDIAIIGGITAGAHDNVVQRVRVGPNDIIGATPAVAVIDDCMGASGNAASAVIDPSLMTSPEPSLSNSPGSSAAPPPTPSPSRPATPSPTPRASPGPAGSRDAEWLPWAAVIAFVAVALGVAAVLARRRAGGSR